MEVNEAARKYGRDKRYTYAEYCTWDDDIRWELIDGYAYMMAPSPSQSHQSTSGNLASQLHSFLKGKQCKVFAAPFDVRLNADAEDDTVVQPDLIVVCDMSKLDGKACVGAPDLAVEILSKSSTRYDRTSKFNRYLKAGVREYWIIDPDSKTLAVHILKESEYVTHAYSDTDTAPVHVLDGCNIDLADVFDD